MNEALIPQDLRARPQWVCWKLEERGGKTTKVPYSPNGQHAKSSDPATWTTFEEACKASRDYAGVGYVFSPDDPFVGIDLDDCLDTDGTVRPWASKCSPRGR
jgi:putative DNA primase/helicase